MTGTHMPWNHEGQTAEEADQDYACDCGSDYIESLGD